MQAKEPDTVFTVEYSVRAAQIAVYQMLGRTRAIPPMTAHDKPSMCSWKHCSRP
jgi:myosin-crossreactive antigen